jgi:hypothetical protein
LYATVNVNGRPDFNGDRHRRFRIHRKSRNIRTDS